MASAAMNREPVDFTGLMPSVAQRLLGEPNKHMSRGQRLRFGNKGSVEVDTGEGWFDDHEAHVRGGVLQLIQHKVGCDKAGAFRWLEEQGLKERSSLPAQRVIGTSTPTPTHSPKPNESTFYDYADESGAVIFRVERRGKGANPPFLQYGPDGRGGFHSTRGCMQGVPRLPYRLPELMAADPDQTVFVCEGEKDVDRLLSLGLVATTNPGGAGKFTADLGKFLTGRRVVALQDNDPAGAAHVQSVLAAVQGVAAKAAALLLPDLALKGDVSDWLDAGGTADELKRLASASLDKPGDLFPIADLTRWSSIAATPKSFLMAGFVPARELTLATGAGGANKSTFGQQLATCVAAGIPMLGIDVQPGPALYITAEDDEDRLHWMQEHMCKALRVRMDSLAGKLHLVSLRGRLGNELATFDGEGKIKPSPAFGVLRETARATKAKLLVIDNAAHVFAGNENDRGQVTAFVNLLYSLCSDLGVTVMLVAHANKAGDSYSGSTAWLNAVRSQVVLARPEAALDPDERVLTLGKANYARQGEELRFRWHNFALVREGDLPADVRAEYAAVAQTAGDNGIFLACLRERERQGEGRAVGPTPGPNYAPTQFEGMPQAKGVRRDRLKAAMNRLFTIGAIETHTYRNTQKGRDVTVIRETSGAASPNPELPPRTVPEHLPRTTPNSSPEVPPAHTPPYGGNAGAAIQAAAPASQATESKRVDWSRFEQNERGSGGVILAPGETGDEPVPGFEEWGRS